MSGKLYITPEEAKNSIGDTNFEKLYEIGVTRLINQEAVKLSIQRASAMTTAALAHNYPGDVEFQAPIPDMAKALTFAWFAVYSWPRNTDLMKQAGIRVNGKDSLEESARLLRDDLRKAVLRVIDALPQPVPTNVGGNQGAIGLSLNCSGPPRRMFDDMGDY